jgi:hypothetical protein
MDQSKTWRRTQLANADRIVLYSQPTEIRAGEPWQSFTAISESSTPTPIGSPPAMTSIRTAAEFIAPSYEEAPWEYPDRFPNRNMQIHVGIPRHAKVLVRPK